MGRLSEAWHHSDFSIRFSGSLTFAYWRKAILLQCPRCDSKRDTNFTNQSECDKSFTRSDALAKHMRTVHEIDTMKTPEPPAKLQATQDHKSKRRRSPSFVENGQGDDDLDQRSDGDDPELALYSTVNRYRYLKRKLRWANDRNSKLRDALQDAESHRWRNWVQKEVLLDRVLAKENINLGWSNAD